MIARYKRPGGFVQLLSLIETSSAAKREKFLELVRAESAAWAQAIETHSLSMERIFGWSDETVSEIFKGLPVRNLACALKGFAPENSRRIMNYMSHSEKRKVEDEMGSLNANPEEFNGTVIKILEITRKMISDGQIRLEKVDPQLEIPEDFEEKLEKMGGPKAEDKAPAAAENRKAEQMQEALLKPQTSGSSADVLQLQRMAQVLTKENKSLREENRILKEKLEQIRKIA
jgi:hypothetical protein